MMKRLFRITLCAALLALSAGSSYASSMRATPVTKAVQRVEASVVNIHSEKRAEDGSSLFSVDRGQKVNGMGTGIIFDERGYIVTNHHVVEGVDALRVTTKDGSNYTASVVSFDRKHDLAVIRINSSRPLTVMPLGTSSDLMLGETVLAIGNAYGYEHTVTGGLISALSRDVEVNEKQSYRNLIQTDASINPGNSGGPLINLDGELIGINVAIRAGAQRIGFAIPIDDARLIIAQLINTERLSNTWHGLVSQDVKHGADRKLVVDNTIADSPASKAGLKTGDVILKVGEISVVDGADFERSLLGRQAGDQVELQVRRNDKTEKLSIAMAAVTQKPASAVTTIIRAPSAKPDDLSEKCWKLFGVKMSPLPDGERNLVAPKYRGGMRVTSVRPNSSAALNGIQQGDVLVGLHIWETVNFENVSYVVEHPQLRSFAPLKFYVLRGDETLWGHLPLTGVR